MPNELLLVLIPAGAAIIAGVAAQITGAAITGRQARRRLEWEQHQAELNRYAELRWHLFGDVMAQLHIIDREVLLCQERTICQENWDGKHYLAAVNALESLIGRTRLVDPSVADELVDFLAQANDYVEEWMTPGYSDGRDWPHKHLPDRIGMIGKRLAAQLGMKSEDRQRSIAGGSTAS